MGGEGRRRQSWHALELEPLRSRSAADERSMERTRWGWARVGAATRQKRTVPARPSVSAEARQAAVLAAPAAAAQAERPADLRTGVQIYVLACPLGLLKLGVAADPKRRLRNLQVGSPLPLTLAAQYPISDRPTAQALAAALQERFRARRERGESRCVRAHAFTGTDQPGIRGNKPFSDRRSPTALTRPSRDVRNVRSRCESGNEHTSSRECLRLLDSHGTRALPPVAPGPDRARRS
jgi:hypothetical protein